MHEWQFRVTRFLNIENVWPWALYLGITAPLIQTLLTARVMPEPMTQHVQKQYKQWLLLGKYLWGCLSAIMRIWLCMIHWSVVNTSTVNDSLHDSLVSFQLCTSTVYISINVEIMSSGVWWKILSFIPQLPSHTHGRKYHFLCVTEHRVLKENNTVSPSVDYVKINNVMN